MFFPPEIKRILQRESPRSSEGFKVYASQLEQDVATFRKHVEHLVATDATAADRISKFKSDVLATKLLPPDNRLIEPVQDPYGSGVVKKNEPHYEIEGYTVVREGQEMRIAGIRFFTKLF